MLVRPLLPHHPDAGDRRRRWSASGACPRSVGTFPTDTPLFVVLVIGVIFVVAALTFLPVLALGPIVEQLGL